MTREEALKKMQAFIDFFPAAKTEIEEIVDALSNPQVPCAYKPNNTMQIKFKKLHQAAKIPTKAHPSDAGFDLTAVSVEQRDDIFTYGTGIAVEIPEGHVGLVFPRSSIADYSTLTLTNSVGVIDSGYRGEIKAKFRMDYNTLHPTSYKIGDRIAQLIILPIPNITFVESEELSDSDRGTGGYGSSGH